ncbi:MAG: mechanosensitive ion channel [Actinomycetota bacterium]|nr:mechanosensitive ion channel [Actinomycetota bacterium]
MEWLTETFGVSESTFKPVLYTVGTFVIILIGRALVLRIVTAPGLGDPESHYRARKVVNYTATIVFLITLAFIWIDAFQNLPTYLGLVSAGIAIALADVLKNMAGWAFILTRRPFQVGDRVEVKGLKGDVVDVRLFRFTLMEVEGWVDAEQSTGRLVHVPNGFVFNNAVHNYTEGFAFIWDELPVLVTFESNWRKAEELIREVLSDAAPDVESAAGSRIRETARTYSIRVGALTPTVYVSVRDSGVLLTARYLVETRTRRGRADRIWRGILDSFDAEPTVALAYPTIRTHLADIVHLRQD